MHRKNVPRSEIKDPFLCQHVKNLSLFHFSSFWYNCTVKCDVQLHTFNSELF